MNSIKNKFILLGMLINLATVSLSGCGTSDNTYKVSNTNIEITWENDESLTGTIPYDDIVGHIKVVILEQNGTILPFLMIREENYIYKAHSIGESTLTYIDLKKGIPMIKYSWIGTNADFNDNEPDSIELGKQIKILEEQELYDYLFELGEIRSELDVTEIIEIYNNEVEPKLIKQIQDEYGYTKILEN